MKSLLKRIINSAGRFRPDQYPAGTRFLTCQDGQVFCGYYDISPFGVGDRFLLALKVPQANATPHDNHPEGETGYYDLAADMGPRWIKVANTACWNWQQGCRLQWLGGNIIYNDFVNGRYISSVWSTQGKKLEEFSFPVYAVSPQNDVAVTLNFSRLHDCRPGYGYSNIADENCSAGAPENDGIFIGDLKDGKYEMILSLKEIVEFKPEPSMADSKHYINHLYFLPSGRELQFFHLWVGQNKKRRSRLLICGRDGGGLRCVDSDLCPSHYAWLRDDLALITGVHNDCPETYHFYRKTDPGFIRESLPLYKDGHPSFVCENNFLTDTYPDLLRHQHLLLSDVSGVQTENFANFYVPPVFSGELRCDLHPRLSRDKKTVAIDVILDERRAIALVPLS